MVPGHVWWPACSHGQKVDNSSSAVADNIVQFADALVTLRDEQSLSLSVCTQTTDIECETNGWLTYDRVSKFTPADTDRLRVANTKVLQETRSGTEVAALTAGTRARVE